MAGNMPSFHQTVPGAARCAPALFRNLPLRESDSVACPRLCQFKFCLMLRSRNNAKLSESTYNHFLSTACPTKSEPALAFAHNGWLKKPD
jgi:hypothetical protein